MTDTPKFGLEQPTEGTTDWHEPLNRNFSRIDDDLLLTVGAESKLDRIQSADGQPAFALDTKAFFIGQADGTWAFQGKIVPDQNGSGEGDGSAVPKPGGVQQAIDRVASAGGGTVRLNPNETYVQDSSFPWNVKSEVILEFNGAVLKGSGSHPDTDMIHVHPQAQIHNPKIDLWDEFNAYSKGNPYTGTVFTFDSKYGAYFSDGTTIRGGWTQAVEAEGTWIYFGKNYASDERVNHVTCITIETNLRKVNEPNNVGPRVIDTGIHLDSSGPDGYLNSIVFRGIVNGASTIIRQTGKHPNNAHIFDGVFQPHEGGDYVWHIEPGTFARGSVMRGKVWDLHRLSTDTAWLIDSSYDKGYGNQRTRNNAISARGMRPEMVVNNSNHAHYVTDPATQQTTRI